jgi:hypothetical protein
MSPALKPLFLIDFSGPEMVEIPLSSTVPTI